MDSAGNKLDMRKLAAFLAPMAAFLTLLGLNSTLEKPGGAFWLASPRVLDLPGANDHLRPAASLVLARISVRGSQADWVPGGGCPCCFRAVDFAPAFFGFAPRIDGFNPEVFSDQPAAYWATVFFRFLRLVVVVPLVEEIFWRGFLLRYLINEKFYAVPVGAFSWLSFALVTVGFGLAHSRADWIPALITGALYNWVAYRTKSLSSCVLAHAITNLLLGLWIMKTRQWGFW